MRQQPRQLNTLASIARWHISSAASGTYNALPGIGFTRFTVTLDKIRNGKPGRWQLEWRQNRFAEVAPATAVADTTTRIRKIV
jgi:protein ImuA